MPAAAIRNRPAAESDNANKNESLFLCSYSRLQAAFQKHDWRLHAPLHSKCRIDRGKIILD